MTYLAKSIICTAIAALPFLSTGPANAALTVNGLVLNGLALNGLVLNGLVLNGTYLQGRNLNGASLQGRNINGVTVQGRSGDASAQAAPGGLRVVGIEIPPRKR